MKYFLDTEFIESGPNEPIYLISIGIVAEDGRELYAINGQCPFQKANEWVLDNVYPHISIKYIEDRYQYIGTSKNFYSCFENIGNDIVEFIGDDSNIEFWGYYSDYDWVVFCQVFGTMVDLPKGKRICTYCKRIVLEHLIDEKGIHLCADTNQYTYSKIVGKFPMFCYDLKQLAMMLGNPQLPKQTSTEHNALEDSRWNKEAYNFLKSYSINNLNSTCHDIIFRK